MVVQLTLDCGWTVAGDRMHVWVCVSATIRTSTVCRSEPARCTVTWRASFARGSPVQCDAECVQQRLAGALSKWRRT